MWPHLRVAWWDVKRALAMRGRRIAAAFALTALAGSGLAASQYYGNLPKPDDVAGHDQPVPASGPTFVSPTLPWPGTNP
ncbi:MAG TPA: hypothetical protein VG034_02360 [Acidimicrobiia bacterium]|jgi:hypothetical protein|nr:hypothetical protein [Acidimicrobiia bacterium]